ncbi:MAG: hypothetical protein AAF810_04540 [Cyanobacteria bacterium P01_D01_bin.36]
MADRRKPGNLSYCKLARENIEFYRGDDLFKVAWIGPTVPAEAPDADKKLSQLKRVFQAHNVLRELTDNWRNGLISQPFQWHLKDSSGERVEASEAELVLQRWIDHIEQQAIYQDPCKTDFEFSDPWSEFVTQVGVTGEAALRLWQPSKFAEMDDPVQRIHLHVPRTGTVVVERDNDGFIESIKYNYGDQLETQTMEPSGAVSVDVSNREEPLVVDTDGRWLIQQIRMPSLFTDSAKRKQGSICHALTMKLRNQELGGFRERTFLNAELPTDEDGNVIIVDRGPGFDRYEYGIPQGDNNSPTYTNPTMVESDPVAVDTFIESIQLDRQLLYLEFRQGHLLADGDGGLSGESRIQMRQNFELYLRSWKRPIESAIANILNIVLRLLDYTELEAVVQLNITTGKLSSEERQAVIAEYQAGLLSKATSLEQLDSVDDVDSELALMEEEAEKAMASRPEPLPRNPAAPDDEDDSEVEDDNP